MVPVVNWASVIEKQEPRNKLSNPTALRFIRVHLTSICLRIQSLSSGVRPVSQLLFSGLVLMPGEKQGYQSRPSGAPISAICWVRLPRCVATVACRIIPPRSLVREEEAADHGSIGYGDNQLACFR